MKIRLLAFLLAFTFILSAVGCNKDPDADTDNPNTPMQSDTPTGDPSDDEKRSDKTPPETEPRHQTSDLAYFEESVTLELDGVYEWLTYYHGYGEETVSVDVDGVFVILGTTWIAGSQYYLKLTLQAMEVGTSRIEIRVGEQVRVLTVTVKDSEADDTDTPDTDPDDPDPKPPADSTYVENSVTLSDQGVFLWYVTFSATGALDVSVDASDVVAVTNTTVISDNAGVIEFCVTVAVTAKDEDTDAQVRLTMGEQVRVLKVHVPGAGTQPSVSDGVAEHIAEVAYLEAYEVYEWVTPFVSTADVTVTQSDESIAAILGASTFIDSDGTEKLRLTIQAMDVNGYTEITVTHGKYTRVLHTHVSGAEPEPPAASGSIFISINDSKEVLTLGERESRMLIMVELPSDGTLTVKSSDERVLSYRHEYHPTLSDNGLVASLELFITPEMPGETIITVSYPEHPSVSLEIPFKVVSEGNVHLGDGNLVDSISVDKTDAEVYRDDTTVTYTVVTSTDVDKLEFIHLSENFYLPVGTFAELVALDDEWVIALDTLTVDSYNLSATKVYIPESKTYYSASRRTENGKYVWTVSWDLGSTAVRFVQVNAVDSDAGITDESYVRLNITYPEFDVSEGLRVVINRWVELNLTEPLIFTVDTDTLTDYQKYIFFERGEPYLLFMDEVELLMGNPTRLSELRKDELSRLKDLTDKEFYDIIFDNNVIYRRAFASGLMQYSMVACMLGNSQYGHGYPQLDGKQILAYDQDTPVFFFHYKIYDETRALIAYENGYEIDAEKFPFAHAALEQGVAIVSEIIRDGMTDFEKEKAIYDWMIQNYYKGVKVPPDIGDPMNPSPEWLACVKGAYGIFNQYEADCMGWSAAFYLLCNMAGVPCAHFSCNGTIPGGADEGFNDANHRISVIRLDGEYYFVEVYWFFQKADPSEGDYLHMNMTAERAAQQYSWIGSESFAPNFANYTTYLVDEHTGELLKP